MKIAECSEVFLPIIDGVATVVTSYARVLAESKNNEVYVFTPQDNTGYRGGLPYEIVDYNSFQLSKKMPWKSGLYSLDITLAQRINYIDLDIVHVHTPTSAGLLGIHLAKEKNVPLIGSFHSKYYEDVIKVTHSKALASVASKMVAEFYEHCDEVWAVSENAGDALKSYGYKGNIVVMPNGVSKRVLNLQRLPEVRKKYGIKDNVPVFLFVGQINWKKNLQRILESCAILKDRGLDFQLVFAGQGPDDKAVAKMATKLNLSDRLVMTGHVLDTEVLDCLYTFADLFLFPSIYDNAPMVLREAACMHTPAVVIEGSSAAEVVKNMSNSLTCKDDSTDMANVIEKYLNLPEEKKEIIKNNAYNTIPVPWETVMEKVLERYQETIDRFKAKK